MALKVKEAINNMINDLGTIEAVSITQNEDTGIVKAYSRIDMDGDVLSYAARKLTKSTRNIHMESVTAAVANRKAMTIFLINTLKSII